MDTSKPEKSARTDLVASLQAKQLKQRQEIARLTRYIEQLEAEKRDLRVDLHKTRAALQQKTGITSGITSHDLA